MKKVLKNKIGLFFLLILGVAFLYGCGQSEEIKVDWTHASWEDITAEAEGSQVQFYMWGGSASINSWVDNVVAPLLQEEYGVLLKRVPMDASVFINKLLAEKAARQEKGSIDLMWINGENFRRAKEEGLLYGSFASKLPNFSLVDPQSVLYDFGTPTEGFEVPFGRAQFVFEYDSAKVDDPPHSFLELMEWVRKHPGKFSYPQPPDFTGSAFLRQALYATSGGYDSFSGEFNEDSFDAKSVPLWEYLNQIKPYLWQEGRTYPADKTRLDGLFIQGEVAINMTYTQAEASGRIADGRYPSTIRTLVFDEGSISNTHFSSIAWNAPNAAGAMVLANILMSPQLQYSKNIPENWGDFTVLDINRLDENWQEKFKSLDLGAATLSLEELAGAAVPEISPLYVEAVEKSWYKEVLQ